MSDQLLTADLADEIRRIYQSAPIYQQRHPLPNHPLTQHDYQQIPILTKADIFTHGHQAFFHDYTRIEHGLTTGDYEYEHTSGTTHGPMTVIMERDWWNAQTRRAYQAHPVLAPFADTPHRKCVLAPVACSSNLCPYEDHPFPNRYNNGTVYLNLSSDPFMFPDSEWNRILIELQATNPDILEGEPIYLSLLARAALKKNIQLPKLRAIILTYGKASLQHSQRIATAFPGIPQIDLYGSTEAGYIFVGTAFKNDTQPITANAFIELLPLNNNPDQGRAVSPKPPFEASLSTNPPAASKHIGFPQPRASDVPQTSESATALRAAPSSHSPQSSTTPLGTSSAQEILLTTRHRQAMPLLRYRTGDIIRQTPTGYTLLGRRDSLYFTEDNTLVSPTEIDTALPDDGTFTCWHYILTQTAPTRWDFHYVADHNAPDTIAQNLAALLGTSTRVNLFRHRSIPPSPSGKFALLKPLPKNTAN